LSKGSFEQLVADAEFIIPCSKGLTVNLHEVARIEESDFLMKDGSSVPISRRKLKDVQRLYDAFLFRKMRKEMLG
jgi:DNA-binding LytR/AlgR family response regulator